MTVKEAEHWLIDNDFNYIKMPPVGGYWSHSKIPHVQISDGYLAENPDKAINWLAEKLTQCDFQQQIQAVTNVVQLFLKTVY